MQDDSRLHNAEEIDAILLNEVVSEYNEKDYAKKEEDSNVLRCSSISLVSEEHEHCDLMMKYFQLKIETCKGLKRTDKEEDAVRGDIVAVVDKASIAESAKDKSDIDRHIAHP